MAFLNNQGVATLWELIKNSFATKAKATTDTDGLMSAADKAKLDGIDNGANAITVDSALSNSSTNPVQNKVINAALLDKAASNHNHNYAGSSSAGGPAMTLMSYPTSASDTAGTWTVNIPNINKLFDGLVIKIKLSTSYNGTYNTLNVNNLGKKLVWYRYNSKVTAHFAINSEITLVYRTNAGKYTNGSDVYTDGWIVDTAYYADSDYRVGYQYYRPLTENSILYRYKLCGITSNGKIEAFTKEDGTGTTKTPTNLSFDLSKGIFHYNSSASTAANSPVGLNTLYKSIYISTTSYTFNSTINTYNDIYLKGTLDKNNLFTLDTSSKTSWYIQVPYNTVPVLSDYFVENAVYVLLGHSGSTNNYLQLILEHPIYKFDGKKLIEINMDTLATNDEKGLMSSEDKTKLDNIDENNLAPKNIKFYNYKGSVSTFNNLPSNNYINDSYFLNTVPSNMHSNMVYWDGTKWLECETYCIIKNIPANIAKLVN